MNLESIHLSPTPRFLRQWLRIIGTTEFSLKVDSTTCNLSCTILASSLRTCLHCHLQVYLSLLALNQKGGGISGSQIGLVAW